METITKTYNIYKFDELSKEVQGKVIKREAEGIKELEIEDFLKEEMEFYAQQLLEENFGDKAIFKNVYYDLSYCQGSGAMIEFDLEYSGKNLEIRHGGGHYYHKHSFNIYGDNLSEFQYSFVYKAVVEVNEELEKLGYTFIEEDRTSQAIEQLKNCMFYENGDIY